MEPEHTAISIVSVQEHAADRIAAEIDLAWQEHEHDIGRSASRRRRDLLPQLAERQNWRCCYCGKRMDGQGNDPLAPSVEHVIPVSRGGTDAPGNLVAACRRCNGERSSAYWREHRQALADVRIRATGTLKFDGAA